MMNKRCVIVSLVLTGVILLLPACKKEETPISEKRIYATMKVIDKGEMVFELTPDKSPKAVEQFVNVANEGFYNNLLFYHVSKGGVVQSGCPGNDGSGHHNKAVKASIDTAYHTARGDLMMNAHFTSDPTAVSSQFIILKQPAPELDGKHPLIGRLIEGAAVLDSVHIGDTLLTVTIEEQKKSTN
ncbi:peptidylprolyl isomerase [candidate division WOR-3 bacterium]|uniref:Peptidyl-prolyl cis-trans isomerase n=1 Tax=candidate division WOR-3 bacterium TaxID=2052148 RepID=A0A9D5QED0_UNCW3|nr:peptidylprolyl isomerase [candidate division WOR-3 bacterium]MBD3364920.1 peptidylprolyl isomerase [candidate division WOR-3 bacterium]